MVDCWCRRNGLAWNKYIRAHLVCGKEKGGGGKKSEHFHHKMNEQGWMFP